MSTLTPLLSLHQAVDTDNAKAYLETNLAADLTVLDQSVMANAISTHISASKVFDVAQDHKQVATPAAPAAGYDRLYFKADDFLYRITSGGTEAVIGNGISNGGSVASAATLPIPAVPAGTPQLYLTVTGVSAITDASNVPALGTEVFIIFGGILTFTHGNHIKMNGGRNFQTAGNAWLHMVSDGTNLWEIARATPTASIATKATATTNQTITGTTSPGTDITGVTATVTTDGVRDVKITVSLPNTANNTTGVQSFALQKDGSIVNTATYSSSSGTPRIPVSFAHIDPAPAAGSHTYKVSAWVSGGTLSTINGDGTSPTNLITVEYFNP